MRGNWRTLDSAFLPSNQPGGMWCPSSSVCLQTIGSFTPTVSWVTHTGPQQTDAETGEQSLTAETCLPPPPATWFGPRASLRVGRDEQGCSSRWQGGAVKTGRSQSPQHLCRHQGLHPSWPPTLGRPSLPQIQKISNNWFGFQPIPFWCKSNSTLH